MSDSPNNEEEIPKDPEGIEEDLAPEPEEKKEPIVSTWDVVILLALGLLGGGFWYWYSGERSTSESHFHVADSLYAAGKYPHALEAYRSIRSDESVISKKHDSLMYLRMDTLENFEEKDLQLATGIRAAIASEDTALIRTASEAVKSLGHGFVPQSLLDSLPH